MTNKTETEHPELMAAVPPEHRKGLVRALLAVVEDKLGKVGRLVGSGVNRYEKLLAAEGLGAPVDRPIPEDLNVALTELGALRDVLIHRGGRVDRRALAQAPSLRYEDGEFVRVSAEEYRLYSAAVRCYATEIQFRPIRNWPEVTDDQLPNLARWRGYCMLGA